VAGIRIPILQLGSTKLMVRQLGLGLAALGRPAYINLGRQQDFGFDRSVAELERRCHEMLDAAYAAGIRYFDAARSYGMAENFLGTWLNARDPP
jgi:aryl-alcohol dehydrogenase-like predicted oxidoreductase